MKTSFKKEGQMIELKGIVDRGALLCITTKKSQEKCKKKTIIGFMRYFFLVEVMEEPKNVMVSSEIGRLLKDYTTMFEEPKCFSPTRKFDYRIPLNLGFNLSIIGLTKVLLFKNEKLVKKMFESCIIQQNISSLASHILLVKKNDNT